MRIGILTYYRVANFGANLQAISTYMYLKKAGHQPIFIHYMSEQLHASTDLKADENPQIKAHLLYIDKVIANQTQICFGADDINRAIAENGIEAIVVGSDAVAQHHPFLSRISFKGRFHHRIRIAKIGAERIFPNFFWGVGLNPAIPKAMMSVSSQGSEYRFFGPFVKHGIKKALSDFSFISVRDNWTKMIFEDITGKSIEKTPDPVFAFNYNADALIPDRQSTLAKFNLPERYVLISFLWTGLPQLEMQQLQQLFEQDGIACVAFPTPRGIPFKHNFAHEIPTPLSPIDWYALIKYSAGYVGSNMHPIIVALHNGVPCYSIDNYIRYDCFGRPQVDSSSKILDILSTFGLSDNYTPHLSSHTQGIAHKIHNAIVTFPHERTLAKAKSMHEAYVAMMDNLLKHLQS